MSEWSRILGYADVEANEGLQEISVSFTSLNPANDVQVRGLQVQLCLGKDSLHLFVFNIGCTCL